MADEWEPLAEHFTRHYSSLIGQVRTFVVDRHLREHLPAPPAALVDVGGGAGDQSIPLARDGYDVTIVDPSRAMLDRAQHRLTDEPAAVADRVRLVEGSGEATPMLLDSARFDGVLCHGVLLYVDDPTPLVRALCALANDRGVVSIVAKNRETLAVRPATKRDWAATLDAFDAQREVNELGRDTRADTVEGLQALLAAHGFTDSTWYGVRLFTEGWGRDQPPTEPDSDLLHAELEASRRDPYRRLSRLFHLLATRPQDLPL